jgi:branched-chain amino acid transport system permease protein
VSLVRVVLLGPGRLAMLGPVAGFGGLAGGLALVWVSIEDDFYLRMLIIAGLFVIIVVPLDLLVGYAGYLSFCQAAFYGLGAYVVGNLTALRFQESYWLALLVAVVVSGVLAYLLTFPLFRLTGVHFAIGTLALGQLAYIVFNSWDWFTGGVFGTNGIPQPAIGSYVFDRNSRFFVLVAIFVFFAALGSWTVSRGSTGLALRAIRQDEVLAQARGLAVARYKRLVFVVAAVFAAIAGALFAPVQVAIDPSSFTVSLSMLLVVMLVLGGPGTLIGPATGAVAYVVLDQLVQSFGQWNQLVLGGVLVVLVLFFPWGLWGAVDRLVRLSLGLTSHRTSPPWWRQLRTALRKTG